MKTFIIPAPKGIDSLALVTRPDPAPGRGQLLLRVRATSLNYRDLITVEGAYARAAPKPDLVPGVFAYIRALAEGVRGVRKA